MPNQDLANAFGNKVRVRVCGYCFVANKILVIKHLGLGQLGYLWSVPGGGVNFGETLTDALKREFLEETGLTIRVNRLCSVSEFMEMPLHAVELFYEVDIIGGHLQKGTDPEMPHHAQIISEIAWLSLPELQAMPLLSLHSSLRKLDTWSDLKIDSY
jgi:8-oxo-dGTP diphosphatase